MVLLCSKKRSLHSHDDLSPAQPHYAVTTFMVSLGLKLDLLGPLAEHLSEDFIPNCPVILTLSSASLNVLVPTGHPQHSLEFAP
jgi:hypothetical protein